MVAYKHQNRPSSDMFSLGILAWEVLSGAPLYPGVTSEEMEARVCSGMRPDIRALPRDLPATPCSA